MSKSPLRVGQGTQSFGKASFALLTKEEQDKKIAEMNKYMSGLQEQVSHTALALSSELKT